MAKRKTREEKKKAAYRLQNFSLEVQGSQSKKDIQEFGYLAKEYIRQDLTKSVLYSVVIISILFAARYYLG